MLLPCGVDDLSEEKLRGLWNDHKEMMEVIDSIYEGESSYRYTNFSAESFLTAVAMFKEKHYRGIIEVLSEAIEKGVST